MWQLLLQKLKKEERLVRSLGASGTEELLGHSGPSGTTRTARKGVHANGQSPQPVGIILQKHVHQCWSGTPFSP